MNRLNTNFSLVLVILLISGCTSNKYLLDDRDAEKKFLIRQIDQLEQENKITNEPLVVIDGIPLDKGNKIQEEFSLTRGDIAGVDYIPKNSEAATSVYGEKGKNGVLLVRTNNRTRIKRTLEGGRVLILLDGKRVASLDMEKIDPSNIESIDVINNNDQEREFENIVVIRMKQDKSK